MIRDSLGVVLTALCAVCSSIDARVFPFDDEEYDFSRRPEMISARFSGVGMFKVVVVEAVNGLAWGTSGWHCSGGDESRVWKPSREILVIITASFDSIGAARQQSAGLKEKARLVLHHEIRHSGDTAIMTSS